MIEGHNLISGDHPRNAKRGGVCICYKKSLAVHKVKITLLTECLVCEVIIHDKKVYVAIVCKS